MVLAPDIPQCEMAKIWVEFRTAEVVSLLRWWGRIVLHVTWLLLPPGAAIFGKHTFWTWNPHVEDWRRVFTTSSGHVTIAPTVPATLNKRILSLSRTKCMRQQWHKMKHYHYLVPVYVQYVMNNLTANDELQNVGNGHVRYTRARRWIIPTTRESPINLLTNQFIDWSIWN
jgi:hypothetical protein